MSKFQLEQNHETLQLVKSQKYALVSYRCLRFSKNESLLQQLRYKKCRANAYEMIKHHIGLVLLHIKVFFVITSAIKQSIHHDHLDPNDWKVYYKN